MTHAFFKALLFMAAGSIIGAMAGEQSLDRMGGFRKAMPFTFGCFVDRRAGAVGRAAVLRLLLQGRDPARSSAERGGWHWVLYVVGYIGAFLTAIYTFRMIFRAFFGEPVPGGARARGRATSHHAERPLNPATGEEEDTDVGFPGPEPPHRRARAADEGRDGRCSRSAAIGRRPRCRSRRSTTSIDELPRADVRRLASYYDDAHARTGCWRSGWSLGAVLGARRASRSPTASGSQRPGTAGARPRARCAALYALFVNKWYFDELIDALVVRPIAGARALRAATRSSASFVDGALVGGTTGRRARRARPPCARVQSGFLRYYAALLCSASPASPSTS